MKIAQITLSASANITETIDVTIDQQEGANYDVLIETTGLNGEDNYLYDGRHHVVLNDGDSIKLTCTNANTTGIVYAKILLIEVYQG